MKGSFEQFPPDQLAQELETTIARRIARPQDTIERAYDRLNQETRSKPLDVDMESWMGQKGKSEQELLFRKAFGDEKVERDLAIVAQQKELHREFFGEYEIARVTEMLLSSELHNAGWFAQEGKSHAVRASKYDDIAHQTDVIVEFFPPGVKLIEGSFIGKSIEAPRFIAIVDVTTSTDVSVLGKKWEQIKALVRAKTLGGFEYYISPRTGDVESHPQGVPTIVVCIPKSIAEELAVLSQLRATSKGKPEEEILSNKLAQHPFVQDFRAQIYEFLFRIRQYASVLQERGQDQRDTTQILKDLMNYLKELGYPTSISDPFLKKQFDRAFRVPRA